MNKDNQLRYSFQIEDHVILTYLHSYMCPDGEVCGSHVEKKSCSL
jgi:hypothetical protein